MAISEQAVIDALGGALSYDATTRAAAEKKLREWESDAEPNFVGSLLRIVSETAAAPEVGSV